MAHARLPAVEVVPARDRRVGLAAVVALECGWIVTEVGRQPWIVYEVMRTEDAVTKAERRRGHVHRRGPALRRPRRGAVVTLRAMARRWRDGERTPRCRTARTAPPGEPSREAGVSSADAVAVVLWIGATMYAVFGGADFGAGLWSLLAGGASAAGARGR